MRWLVYHIFNLYVLCILLSSRRIELYGHVGTNPCCFPLSVCLCVTIAVLSSLQIKKWRSLQFCQQQIPSSMTLTLKRSFLPYVLPSFFAKMRADRCLKFQFCERFANISNLYLLQCTHELRWRIRCVRVGSSRDNIVSVNCYKFSHS